MNTATSQLVHAPPPSATPHLVNPRRHSLASPGRPTWREVFKEAAPMIDAPAFYGPPIIFVLGPWLFMVLLLIGPFALVFTVLLALAAAAALIAVFVAAIASPYLLMRHLRSYLTARAEPRARQHLRKHRVSSGRLGSAQPKVVP
jgi:hypothetical protein